MRCDVKRRNLLSPPPFKRPMYWPQRLDSTPGGENGRKVCRMPSLSYLYRQQADKCAHCHPTIITETGWGWHHLHPKHCGGKDSDDNLVLLYPNCHEPVHHEGQQLEQPPPRCCTVRKKTGQVL